MAERDLAEVAAILRAACGSIAGQCDGALTEDGVGFSKADTSFGCDIATVPSEDWDAETCCAVHGMLAKYAGQLADCGIAYRDLPVPAVQVVWERREVTARLKGKARDIEDKKTFEDFAARRIDRRTVVGTLTKRLLACANPDGSWDLYSPKDMDLVAAIKALPWKRLWTGSCWHLEGAARAGLPKLIEDFGFWVTPEDRARLSAQLEAKPAAPRPVAPPKPVEHITLEGNRIVARTPYDPEAVAEMGRIPGRRWDAERKVNTFPLEAVAAALVVSLADRRRYGMGEATRAKLVAVQDAAKVLVNASSAADAELDVPGLGSGVLKLRPFQRAGVRYAMETKRTFIADEMGLGKTIQALGAIQALNAYPALVVVPKAVKLQWAGEASRWLPDRTRLVIGGTKPLATYGADLVFVNYDVLTGHLAGLAAVKWGAIVLDESHYIKSKDARRTKAALALAQNVPVRLCLTGTSVLNRPIELVSQLEFLGRMDDLGGFWTFAKSYCGATRTQYGWDMTGASNLDELSKKLRATCYVRREKKDVATELPPIQRALVPMELENPAAYKRALNDVVAWMKAKRQSKKTVDFDQNSYNVEALAKIEGLRQLVVEHKLTSCIEWVKTFLDGNGKLVLFAHHRNIQDRLAQALAEYEPARISGGDEDGDEALGTGRAGEIKRFWDDPKCRVMVASLKAGNVGINLQCASDVAFVEFGWNDADHAQAEARVHRIGSTALNINSYWLYAPDTFDDASIELIEQKRIIVEAVNQGQHIEPSESITSWLERKLLSL